MLIRVLRYTPKRTLTYNNRWYNKVFPKHTLFFIPPQEEQVLPWLDFLCTKHHKTCLYLHIIVLDVVRYKVRVLTMWKGFPLIEVLVRDRDYIKRRFFRTQRVLKGAKSMPALIKHFM